MTYTAPALTNSVTLQNGYIPPLITAPILLGAPTIGATTLVTLAAPTLSLVASAYADVIDPAAIAATLAPLTRPISLAAHGLMGYPIAIAAALPPVSVSNAISCACVVAVDLDLPDADGVRASLTAAHGLKTTATGQWWYAHGISIANALPCSHTSAQPIRVSTELLASASITIRKGEQLLAQQAVQVTTARSVIASETIRTRTNVRLTQADTLPLHGGARIAQTETIRTYASSQVAEQSAERAVRLLHVNEQPAIPTSVRLALRWAQATQPSPGRWWSRYVVPPLISAITLYPGYTPRPLRCPVLLYWFPVQQPLCPDEIAARVVVPVQEIYYVLNSFSLVRADTGATIEALDFSADLSADDWGWSWTATIPASALSLVRSPTLGEWVEVIATLNGTPIRLTVERLVRTRQFGKAALKISGRCRASILAEPASPVITVTNTETRTARQLLDTALMINGVSLGWTVDWRLEDWSVPATAWSYSGTYLGAALRIAEAGGGYVQADETAKTLHLYPYYPVSPWVWASATPDLQLPEDVCITEDIEWTDKAIYNAVWIVGGENGRRDKVKRAGTAADLHAPTIVDPLATDTVMTRQRGLRAIADTGRQALISVKLPILQQTGIINPGKLIRYTERGVTHLGLSRRVSVSWQFPAAWQTIGIETHV